MPLVVDGSQEAIDATLGNMRANLAALKVSRNMTNADLGLLAQVGEKTVWSWFKQNRVPDLENLIPIATAFEIPFGELFLDPVAFSELHGVGDGNFQLTVVSNSRSSAEASKDGHRRAESAGRKGRRSPRTGYGDSAASGQQLYATAAGF